MEQIGHCPGWLRTTCGCIGQYHSSCASAAANLLGGRVHLSTCALMLSQYPTKSAATTKIATKRSRAKNIFVTVQTFSEVVMASLVLKLCNRHPEVLRRI